MKLSQLFPLNRFQGALSHAAREIQANGQNIPPFPIPKRIIRIIIRRRDAALFKTLNQAELRG